jgi:cation:H+ antiporter
LNDILLFAGGLIFLIAGAESLVRGASKLALSFGLSPLVVGLTVVAFGTSSPELAVSVKSAYAGQADIALGNVVGSNILNILFILGISALIAPLVVARQVVRQEVPIMIGASVLLFVLALDGTISRGDGTMLVVLLTGYTFFLIRQSRQAGPESVADDLKESDTSGTRAMDRHWPVQLLLIVAGLALLVLGSNWLVESAVAFARRFGISEMVIGLTIIAAGTSLPEVATSVMAAIRGERDIAVGNVIGSNLFNIFAVLGVSALVAPVALSVPQAMISFDLLVMLAVAIACLPIFFTGNLIARWEGALFLGYYLAYTSYLILAAQEHDALQTYGTVMGWVVLPLTAVTITVFAWREWHRRGA